MTEKGIDYVVISERVIGAQGNDAKLLICLAAIKAGTRFNRESGWFVRRGRRAAGKPELIAWLSPERTAGGETNGQ